MKSTLVGTSVTSCNWVKNGTVIVTDWPGCRPLSLRPVCVSIVVMLIYARETSLVPKGGYGFVPAKFGKLSDCGGTKIACIHKSGFPMVAPFWITGKNTLLSDLALLTMTIFFSGGWLGTVAEELLAKPRTRRRRVDINVRDVFVTDLFRLRVIPVETVRTQFELSSTSPLFR